jgi:hypothetical protein
MLAKKPLDHQWTDEHVTLAFCEWDGAVLQVVAPNGELQSDQIVNQDLRAFGTYAHKAGWQCSLFSTEKGLVGLAPGTVQVGDHLILVPSHCSVMVLRPKGGTNQSGGFAYVQGFTNTQTRRSADQESESANGEHLWHMATNAGIKEEIFQVR